MHGSRFTSSNSSLSSTTNGNNLHQQIDQAQTGAIPHKRITELKKEPQFLTSKNKLAITPAVSRNLSGTLSVLRCRPNFIGDVSTSSNPVPTNQIDQDSILSKELSRLNLQHGALEAPLEIDEKLQETIRNHLNANNTLEQIANEHGIIDANKWFILEKMVIENLTPDHIQHFLNQGIAPNKISDEIGIKKLENKWQVTTLVRKVLSECEFELIKSLAYNHDPMALTELGTRILDGEVSQEFKALYAKEYRKFINQLQASANRGDQASKAKYNRRVIMGELVPKYAKKYTEKLALIYSFQFYCEAAKENDALGQTMLSDFYFKGIGGAKKDKEKANSLLICAAANGDILAQKKLAFYFYDNGEEQNLKLAAKYARLGALQNDEECESLLGDLYRNGRGVDQDLAEAKKWYERAAQKGDMGAQNELASMFLTGDGVPQDIEWALSLYRQNAEQGDLDAQAALEAWAAPENAPVRMAQTNDFIV